MYKITINDKTMVGCNEDAWRLTSRIWFENGTNTNPYGAAFTGSRFDGANGYAPQSGMNEFGLSFSRLASHKPENHITIPQNKKNISNPTLYLKQIIHSCKTVEEVKDFISQYDYSYFIEDVFIYIDRSGKYLVVEPYHMSIGQESKYVLSNFCPSATPEKDAMKLDRYRKGIGFLKNKLDTTLSFCTALSDTMHVCREKIGDGTLLTSIWDLKNGHIHLCFYHQYKNSVQFSLKDELAKGDHMIEIPALFEPNSEFEQLRHYKIPQNNMLIMGFLMASGILFFLSSLFFIINYFRTGQNTKYAYIQLALFPLGFILLFYMFTLCRTTYIFYFPSPYRDTQNIFVSMVSYVPFLILLLIIPFLLINRKLWKEKLWGSFSKWLFTLNNAVYSVLLVLFVYWGLFNVFG